MTASGFRRALIGIALGGLALRLIYAYAIVKSRPLLGDALEFQQQANLLADGHGYIQLGAWQFSHVALPTADKPPVYPFLEAFISLLGGRTWAWHDLVGVLAGTATVVVVGLLGNRVGGQRVGIVAAALAAVYPLLIAADGSLRSESVYALLVTLVLLAALRLRESPSTRRAALLGAAIALAALTRGEALLLLVLLPFGLAGLRRGLVSVVACVLVLSPWLARCWIAFGQPVLISTNVGGLLAGANCPQTYSGPLLGQWTLACLPAPRYTNEAREANRMRDIGLRYAIDHAGRLPVVIAARLGRSFELYRPREQWTMEGFYEGRNLKVEEAGVLTYYVVVLLAVVGALALRRRRGPWGVLLAPVIVVAFVSITAYGFTRFRVAAEPGLIVLAAVAIDVLLKRWRSRRRALAVEPRDTGESVPRPVEPTGA
jgi:4-amino-4-deoxy-L-arabinose transferase-like glycosyltransferase